LKKAKEAQTANFGLANQSINAALLNVQEARERALKGLQGDGVHVVRSISEQIDQANMDERVRMALEASRPQGGVEVDYRERVKRILAASDNRNVQVMSVVGEKAIELASEYISFDHALIVAVADDSNYEALLHDFPGVTLHQSEVVSEGQISGTKIAAKARQYLRDTAGPGIQINLLTIVDDVWSDSVDRQGHTVMTVTEYIKQIQSDLRDMEIDPEDLQSGDGLRLLNAADRLKLLISA